MARAGAAAIAFASSLNHVALTALPRRSDVESNSLNGTIPATLGSLASLTVMCVTRAHSPTASSARCRGAADAAEPFVMRGMQGLSS